MTFIKAQNSLISRVDFRLLLQILRNVDLFAMDNRIFAAGILVDWRIRRLWFEVVINLCQGSVQEVSLFIFFDKHLARHWIRGLLLLIHAALSALCFLSHTHCRWKTWEWISFGSDEQIQLGQLHLQGTIAYISQISFPLCWFELRLIPYDLLALKHTKIAFDSVIYNTDG